MRSHCESGTRLYSIWRDMRHRCVCPGIKNYKYYGERGITVCKEWDDYEKFRKWALSNGYKDNLTIDRKDVNGNYCPENCRWVNMSIQNANRRNIGKCEYIGVSLSSNGSSYVTSIKYKGKIIFYFRSRSKNECAEKRNKFILENNLPYPLNEIKEECEDFRIYKTDSQFIAKHRESGKVVLCNSSKELASQIGLTSSFINECIRGERRSREYIFYKRSLYDKINTRG